jgi:hypothetical protein
MARIAYLGGEMAGKGNYWNFSTGERITIETEGKLPGEDSKVYFKASPLLVLAAGPVLGLLYAVFLPFIGIVMLLSVALSKMLGGSSEKLAAVANFNWSPSAVYLAGRRHKKEKKADNSPKDEGPGHKA